MPVVVGIVLPLAAVAVSMLTAAGCRDGFGCHRITADGAFLMLRTVGGSRCRSINNPVACGVCCNIFLIAAGAFMPVVVGIVLPLAAATTFIAACAAIAQNRQRVGFSTDYHDNVGCAAVGDGNGCAAAGGQSLSVDAHGLAVSRHRCD